MLNSRSSGIEASLFTLNRITWQAEVCRMPLSEAQPEIYFGLSTLPTHLPICMDLPEPLVVHQEISWRS